MGLRLLHWNVRNERLFLVLQYNKWWKVKRSYLLLLSIPPRLLCTSTSQIAVTLSDNHPSPTSFIWINSIHFNRFFKVIANQYLCCISPPIITLYLRLSHTELFSFPPFFFPLFLSIFFLPRFPPSIVLYLGSVKQCLWLINIRMNI